MEGGAEQVVPGRAEGQPRHHLLENLAPQVVGVGVVTREQRRHLLRQAPHAVALLDDVEPFEYPEPCGDEVAIGVDVGEVFDTSWEAVEDALFAGGEQSPAADVAVADVVERSSGGSEVHWGSMAR